MLCRIYRWKLSGAIDSGKSPSDGVKRHLLRCSSCREFAALAEDAGRRLTRDAEALIGSTDPGLTDRVRASLGDRVEPSRNREINNQVPIFEAALPQGADLPHKRILRLRPVLTAAVALVVVGAGVLYMVRWRPQPTPELKRPFQIEQPETYLAAALEKAGSPYDEEIRRWKTTFDGAAERLRSAFDIGLGEANN